MYLCGKSHINDIWLAQWVWRKMAKKNSWHWILREKKSENVSLYAVNSSFICSYITLSGFSIVLVENVQLKYKEAFTYSKDFPFNLIGVLPAYAIPNMLVVQHHSKGTTWALKVISLLKSPSTHILQDCEGGEGVDAQTALPWVHKEVYLHTLMSILMPWLWI